MLNTMLRLDKELHLRQHFNLKSRTAAADLISEGKVSVNGVICTKPSFLVSEDDLIEIVGEQLKYVSRGGLKLEHALDVFGIDLYGKVCLDVGASTGGFTDCMLQRRASRVYAVDVGSNQLDEKLKQDERVISMENCDIRTAKFAEKIDFTAVDVSFISLKLILPVLPKSNAVVLIKPQFELGKKHKGVITAQKVHEKIVADIAEFAVGAGFSHPQITESPIIGKSGNKEFLMLL